MLISKDVERIGQIMLKDTNVSVVVKGTEAYTDGKTIVLPDIGEINNPRLRDLMMCFDDHECDHHLAKSCFTVLKECGEDEKIMLNALEDVRVEAVGCSLFPGQRVNLRRGTIIIMEDFEEEAKKGSEQGKFLQTNKLKQLTSAVYLLPSGIETTWIGEDIKTIVAKYADKIKTIHQWAKRTRDLLPLTRELLAEIMPPKPPQEKQPESQKSPNQPKEPKSPKSKKKDEEAGEEKQEEDREPGKEKEEGGEGEGESEGEGEEEKEEEGSSSSSGEEQGESEEGAGEGGGEGQSEGSGEASPPQQASSKSVDSSSPIGGNELSQGYSQGAFDPSKGLAEKLNKEIVDSVNKGPLALDNKIKMLKFKSPDAVRWPRFSGYGLNTENGPRFTAMLPGVIGACGQRLLQMLKGEERTGWNTAQTKGSPDPRKLASLVLDKSSRVLRTPTIDEAPSTACALVMDLSGSMRQSGYTKAWDQGMAAAAFAKILCSGGHPCAVWGFKNLEDRSQQPLSEDFMYGTDEQGNTISAFMPILEPVNLWVAKDWDERATKDKCARIMEMSLGASSGTPLLSAILAAGTEVLKRPEDRRVLIVFTDGQGSATDGLSMEEAYQGTCKRLENNGCTVVIVGIGHDVSSLHHRTAVVKSSHDLTRTTITQLQKALTGGR